MSGTGYNYDYTFKFIIIGDASVGKSCIMRQFIDQRFASDCPHTIGVEYGTKIVQTKEGKRVKLQIWDTAGQERFRAVTRSYYRGAAGVIIVYDTTKRMSFNNVGTWLNDAGSLALPSTVKILIGNKVDLEDQRDITYQEAETFAADNDVRFLEGSAKTGKNIQEAFDEMVQSILDKISDGSLDLTNQSSGVMSQRPAPVTNLSQPQDNPAANSSCC